MTETSITPPAAAPISDSRLVDYLLRVLPADEIRQIEQQLTADSALQQRLAAWEAALFQLNRETKPVAPPPRVWQQIERACFNDTEKQAAQPAWWSRWARFAVPVLLALSVVWVGSVTLVQRPTYAATVAMTTADPMWEISGNAEAITFVSVKNIAMTGMNCVAWVERDGAEPVLLGTVPDWGGEASKVIELPQDLNLQAGDRVTIGMIKTGALETPPSQSMMPVTVVLATI